MTIEKINAHQIESRQRAHKHTHKRAIIMIVIDSFDFQSSICSGRGAKNEKGIDKVSKNNRSSTMMREQQNTIGWHSLICFHERIQSFLSHLGRFGQKW